MGIVTGNGGVFTGQNITQINDEFARLSAAQAGGTLASAKILVGDGSNLSAAVDMSGDATIDNTGAVSIAAGVTNHDLVSGPASVTANKVALFNGTTGKIIKADAAGASAGPFTTITSITVVNGLVTAITGS